MPAPHGRLMLDLHRAAYLVTRIYRLSMAFSATPVPAAPYDGTVRQAADPDILHVKPGSRG